MRDKSHDEAMGELLRALRQIADASGGISLLAERSNLNRTQLYRALSEKGNPALGSLVAILKPLGLRLTVAQASPSPTA